MATKTSLKHQHEFGEPYAELTLYLGTCDSMGGGEGPIEWNGEDVNSILRYQRTVDHVKMYLSYSWWRKSRQYVSYSKSLGCSEEEAIDLIAFAEQNINEARGIITPYYCSHGKIFFYRQIRFDGWIPKKKKKLIGALKEFGYKPKEGLTRLDIFKQIYKQICSEEKYQQELEKAVDEVWERALEFHN